jgi:hypothetical protein
LAIDETGGLLTVRTDPNGRAAEYGWPGRLTV